MMTLARRRFLFGHAAVSPGKRLYDDTYIVPAVKKIK
jgi:hypothetical protein